MAKNRAGMALPWVLTKLDPGLSPGSNDPRNR